MTLLIVIHSIVCLFLVTVILLQPGKGDAGIGFGSSSQSIFGSKGAGNFLTKLTALCAFSYLLISFILTWQRTSREDDTVIKEDSPQKVESKQSDEKAPAATKPEEKK